MGKITNRVEYLIYNKGSELYLKLLDHNVVAGSSDPHGDEYIFVAIQTEDMEEDGGYALQPKNNSNYVNNQAQYDNYGDLYYAAVADVSQPYIFHIDPTDENEEVSVYTTNSFDIAMTMPLLEENQVTLEEKSDEKKERQKWVFVRKDGSTEPVDPEKK